MKTRDSWAEVYGIAAPYSAECAGSKCKGCECRCHERAGGSRLKRIVKRLLFPPPLIMAVFWAIYAVVEWRDEGQAAKGWFAFSCCAVLFNLDCWFDGKDYGGEAPR